jgi:hypothetical protein
MFRPPVADPDPDPEWSGRGRRKNLPTLLVFYYKKNSLTLKKILRLVALNTNFKDLIKIPSLEEKI